jgi:small subunit ribosomal protein S16
MSFPTLEAEQMVTMRLSRAGAKKRPFYHIVVTDSRKRRDSGYIERIGFFNPGARGKEVKLNIDLARVDHWLSVGAGTSDRVDTLIREQRKAG